ncbi:DUF4296 domain-containing protein [Lacibacter sp. H375]|uniref:DUF4296 domain-containing protein n=1 Tax=Lacibacter sp. H375 TaxID=3133424 RepID=UPI0030BD3590
MREILLLLCLFGIVACSETKKPPANILGPEKFQKILTDVILADALSTERSFKDTSLKIKDANASYFLKIFEIHGVTKNEFMRSYNFYLSRPDLLRVISDSVSAVLNRENLKLTTDTVKPKPNGNNSPKIRIRDGNK